jgi:hypothetical protein
MRIAIFGLTVVMEHLERGSTEDLAARRAALTAFQTQRETLAQFPDGPERCRIAPPDDFHSPLHARLLQYQRWWPGEIDWETWHRAVAPALAPPLELASW